MKYIFLLVLSLYFSTHFLAAQNVGIGTTSPQEKLDVNGNSLMSGYIRAHAIILHANNFYVPHQSAILDIRSSTQGILIPRMNMAQRNAISNPEWGLLIFQTDNNPGFYYNKGIITPEWIKVGGEDTNKGFLPYTSAGIHNFNVPQGITSLEYEAIASGGGGGGGQAYNASYCGVGGGGGAGGYSRGILKVNPGDAITVIIGAPGTGGTTNTTPTTGAAGTNAANTIIQVNAVTVLELSGGQGGAGGYSDGTQNTGLGITGGNGGIPVSNNSSVTVYSSGGGGAGLTGASWNTGTAALEWGTHGHVNAYTHFSLLDGSGRPVSGRGGSGGNNVNQGANGQVGYVKFKY